MKAKKGGMRSKLCCAVLCSVRCLKLPRSSKVTVPELIGFSGRTGADRGNQITQYKAVLIDLQEPGGEEMSEGVPFPFAQVMDESRPGCCSKQQRQQ